MRIDVTILPLIANNPGAAAWPEWILYFGQFKSYMALFAVAAVTTAIATPVYIIVAGRMGWVDAPVGRKRHRQATATMGGAVIFVVVFIGALVALSLDNHVGRMLQAHRSFVYGLIACTTCMVLLGMIDDRNPIRPRVKLMVQAVVAVAAILMGFQVQALTLPWLDSVVLPAAVGVILSFLWIIGITNAINLTDGLDGLAAGICLLAAAVNAITAIWLGNHFMSVMMVLLAGALLGFLRYNFHPARVFLGDTGSLALGMYIALASLHSAQKAHTFVMLMMPLFALGYPIFDTLLAIGRRMVRGQPLFASDRDHIHHRLLDRGRTPSSAAIQIYIATFVISMLCLAAATANHFVLGFGIASVGVIAVISARVLGYLEWGGWVARWSGREETKVLHAAAGLARLKIKAAATESQMLRAVAVLSNEVGCLRMELDRDGEITDWENQDVDGQEGGAHVVEMPLGDNAVIRLTLAGAGPIDDEAAQLLEELCSEAGERLP